MVTTHSLLIVGLATQLYHICSPLRETTLPCTKMFTTDYSTGSCISLIKFLIGHKIVECKHCSSYASHSYLAGLQKKYFPQLHIQVYWYTVQYTCLCVRVQETNWLQQNNNNNNIVRYQIHMWKTVRVQTAHLSGLPSSAFVDAVCQLANSLLWKLFGPGTDQTRH